METKNIEITRKMNGDSRFIAESREYAAAMLDITSHFVELEHHFANLTWGVETQARNNGRTDSRWASLHVFCEIAGEHAETYRQMNIDSYEGQYDGYALCAKVEDFIDDFVKEYQDKLN